jgi:hypothetical protein
MKRGHIGSSLFFVALMVHASITAALAEDKQISDNDLTCKVDGGPFALDDDDFKAMQNVTLRDGRKATKETFALLSPMTQKSICVTRMLARRLKTGKSGPCDFDTKGPYKEYNIGWFADSELPLVDKALSKSMAQALATGKTCASAAPAGREIQKPHKTACADSKGQAVTISGAVYRASQSSANSYHFVIKQPSCGSKGGDELVAVLGGGRLPCPNDSKVAVTGVIQRAEGDAARSQYMFAFLTDMIVRDPARVVCSQ